eukprot:TRINITY_DN1645_c0_g1_i2.p1 TRINITY_DN1645_c0_g1~~TRINITY_DN1645_c0_g1_i2.p1  ORF type:complete len:276 (+),score=94.66 TRINITY_DN1645_c0_g1_i2:33-830(+)
MPLPITYFRKDGGCIEKLKESQRRRGKDEKIIDDITGLDEQWRKAQFEMEQARKIISQKSKQVGELKKKKENADAVVDEVKKLKEGTEVLAKKADDLLDSLNKLINKVGNIVHDSVVVSRDEKDNKEVFVWGKTERTGKERHHHELLYMIGGYEPERGSNIAGHRGYFLKDYGVMLNQALINFAIDFLRKRKYTILQPPFFMNKSIMAGTAQLEDFDDQLYKVTGGKDEEEKYLIATSEQPISAYHREETLDEKDLPPSMINYTK